MYFIHRINMTILPCALLLRLFQPQQPQALLHGRRLFVM
jgi:hypothetical protein